MYKLTINKNAASGKEIQVMGDCRVSLCDMKDCMFNRNQKCTRETVIINSANQCSYYQSGNKWTNSLNKEDN